MVRKVSRRLSRTDRLLWNEITCGFSAEIQRCEVPKARVVKKLSRTGSPYFHGLSTQTSYRISAVPCVDALWSHQIVQSSLSLSTLDMM